MAFWLTTPLIRHEPPGSVVARVLLTTAAKVDGGLRGRLVVGTHSGLLRALVHWASDADPGEPENAEEVVIAASPGNGAGTAPATGGGRCTLLAPSRTGSWSCRCRPALTRR